MEGSIQFSVPHSRCLSEPVVVGIDEAGRGPVMGPMVFGGAYWPLSDEERIAKMGFQGECWIRRRQRKVLQFEGLCDTKLLLLAVLDSTMNAWKVLQREGSCDTKLLLLARPFSARYPLLHQSPCADSKTLSFQSREKLFSKICGCPEIGYVIVSLSSEMISGNMLGRQPYSLNALSHDAAVRIVQHLLDAGVRVSHVYVDTVGDPGMYQAKLTRIFQGRIVFTVSKKADSLFKTVSAASIAAKVDRDKALVNWVYKEPVLREAMGAMRAAATKSRVSSSSGSGGGGGGAGSSGSSSSSNSSSGGGGGAAFDDDEDEMDPFGGAAPFSDEDEDVEGGSAASSSSKSAAGNSNSSSSSATSGKRSRSEISESTGGSPLEPSSSASSAVAQYASWILPVSAGSGYPGDARTKRWLRDSIDPIFGWPSIVRFSWSTCKELMDKECAAVNWEGELDEDEAAAEWRKPVSGAAPLTNFFARVGGAPARSPFFKSRGLEHITNF